MIEDLLSRSDIGRYKKRHGTFYREAIINDLRKYAKKVVRNLKETASKSKKNLERKQTTTQKESTIKNQEIRGNNYDNNNGD